MPGRTCTMPDCENVYHAKGYCSLHYRRLLRGTLHRMSYRIAATRAAAAGEPVDWVMVKPVEQVMGLPLTHENVPEIVMRVRRWLEARAREKMLSDRLQP